MTSSPTRAMAILLLGILAISFGGCETQPTKPEKQPPASAARKNIPPAYPGRVPVPLPDSRQQSLHRALKEFQRKNLSDTLVPPPTKPAPPDAEEPDKSLYLPGTETFIRRPSPAPSSKQETGDVTLNFENTNLLEVVKVILGDLLQINYVVDPRVQGSVTLQTSSPLSRKALLPTLEMLLRMNNAALVRRDGLFHVVPRENAVRGLLEPQLGGTTAPLPSGYNVRIVPLRYVAASEMQKILEPFLVTDNLLRVDKERNLLILAGTGQELDRLLATIEVFDVDWLEGMSMALLTPRYVEAKLLAEELEKVFGSDAEGPLGGLIRLVPVERLNALLVITARQEYLQKIALWVDRLDKEGAGVGRRLFVYYVENGNALDIADVLNQVFGGAETPRAARRPELAPGLQGTEIRSRARENLTQAEENLGQAVEADPEAARRRQASPQRQGGIGTESDTLRIIPDEINNALLIWATRTEYEEVLNALRKMDIVPLQVLIETIIAEIALTDDLRFGLEWFFKYGVGNKNAVSTLDLNPPAGLASIVPGFSYAIVNAAGEVQAVMNALADESKLNVLSSPSLMVLNNQEATIQVGDEVPIVTRQQQSTTTVDAANLINNVEYRETGVLLSVKPRVNAGGLVLMDVEQEVSNVAPGTAEDSLTPTILQRKIKSSVAVQSGQTLVLGGLIRESDSTSKSGFPGLHTIPVLGALFGQTIDQFNRVELVVLITPRAIQNSTESRHITEEFRNKMESLRPLTKGF